ncbi:MULTISPECIES: DUF6074 family protein [Rhizobium]|nr:DUF6074 family protein [Rhizobium paranaense]
MAVIQFPVHRRTAEVERCAKALQRLHGEEANRFWRSEMAAFAAALEQQGMDEESISRQASCFMHAVQIALQCAFSMNEARS